MSKAAVWILAAALAARADELDRSLAKTLQSAGFTGRVGRPALERRLGRSINPALANLGRLLFFDPAIGLRGDNSCAGCHSPTAGFGDSQPIAIGILNNGVVGRGRSGPRNQRRTPSVVNTAFYPKLMWNGRFEALSGDPFNSSKGFQFPDPEGTTRFPANDPKIYHLLVAQAHIPPTELVEAAGFRRTQGNIDPLFDVFDDGKGTAVPPPDQSGFRNEPIRLAVSRRLNAIPAYRRLFGQVFGEVARGGDIDFVMFAQAIAEFEFTLTRADAPIDRFARGETAAMKPAEKRGAMLFFGAAGCTVCHAVSGAASEVFSDFAMHNIGVPQVAPAFGKTTGNVVFDGPDQDEDFGLEQITGRAEDRYKFRTSPLRNAGLQPAFFHNGAFTRLRDAIAHHLDPARSARHYSPLLAGAAPDLWWRRGPLEPLLTGLDPWLPRTSFQPGIDDLDDLVAFVGTGLLDSATRPEALCAMIPLQAPSGFAPHRFEGCE